METLQQPLSKYQLEMLAMFNNKSITEDEWGALKEMVADFFAHTSLRAAEKAWDENNWDEKKIDDLLKTHLRTPYNQHNQFG